MKATFTFFFCIFLVSTCVMAETNCPAICPLNYQPICGISPGGETKTFANQCDMDATNCRERSSFTMKSEGAC
ncbi:vasotab-TY1-like [Arctopsyche grandis]|uniref:vasotab-TY1-like n=1 Tax=Arctopsyche grandis TaxID=121162 RepID=UPI00406D7505